jgi:hypothetical protein
MITMAPNLDRTAKNGMDEPKWTKRTNDSPEKLPDYRFQAKPAAPAPDAFRSFPRRAGSLQGVHAHLDQVLGPPSLQESLNPVHHFHIHPATGPLVVGHPKREMKQASPRAQELRGIQAKGMLPHVPPRQPLFCLLLGLFRRDQDRKDGLSGRFFAQLGLYIGIGAKSTDRVDQDIMNLSPRFRRLMKGEEIMGDMDFLDTNQTAAAGTRKEEGTQEPPPLLLPFAQDGFYLRERQNRLGNLDLG